MGSFTKMLSMAAGVFILCCLISIMYMQYNDVAEASKSEQLSIQQMQGEYNLSSLRTLENVNLTGATVVSSIRKYVSDFPITIAYRNGEVKELARKSFFANVEETSPYYVKDDAIFTCKLEYNGNGVLQRLVFTEKGATVSGSSFTDTRSSDEIKKELVDAVNDATIADLGMDWSTISSKLSSVINSEKKNTLRQELGLPADEKYSWDALADKAVKKLEELQGSLSSAEDTINSCQHISLTLDTLVSLEDLESEDEDEDLYLPTAEKIDGIEPIGFVPDVAVVRVNEAGTTKIYYYSKKGAAGDSAGMWSSSDDASIAEGTFKRLVIGEYQNSDGEYGMYLLNFTGYSVEVDAVKY